MTRNARWLLASAAGALLIAPAGTIAQPEPARAGAKGTTLDGHLSPRLHSLGTYSRKVSTTNANAQKFFDQGLVLAYAFNHAEAVRSFKEAARLDPNLAMAYWGEAYALGPNINAPMDETAVPPAYEAIQKAVSLKAGASEVERAMIDAMATRYAKDPKADRAALDKTYADAMRALASKYPQDADILSIAAESIMDTDPWNYWTNDGSPRPYTRDVIGLIEKAIAINSNHPLALHLHIHALEASQEAFRAVGAAERLGALAPGAGHLVHMPSHIFFRVGRYGEAEQSNIKAIAADEGYIAQCNAQGIYPAAYYPHNIHFLWIAQTYQGKSRDAIAAADKCASKPPGEMHAGLQQFLTAPYYARVRFAKWDQLLAMPKPGEELAFLTGVWHFGRGMALANTGKADEAESELASLKAVVERADFPKELILVNSRPSTLMGIAEHLVSGSIAEARGDWDTAIAAYGAAVRLEDSTTYNEPPDWPLATRHWLGSALLGADRPIEAEAVFLEDLRRRPENGWGLTGLVQALKAQGPDRMVDLTQAQARLEKAWAKADVKLAGAKW